MTPIHQLVLQHGRDQARQMVEPGDRVLVDVASEILSVEEEALGISYSGFAMTALPHRRVADGEVWERISPTVTLTVRPGRLPTGRGDTEEVGVPFGAHARLVLLYLQTQALRTGSPEVEVGRSLNAFLERLGVSVGGNSYKSVRDQLRRIAGCDLLFSWRDSSDMSKGTGFVKGGFVKGGQLPFLSGDGRQGSLWEERLLLDQAFFDALKAHPVPLLEQALRVIGGSSVALDLYIWLAFRLKHLKKPLSVPWEALHSQFGSEYARVRDFKRHIVGPLKLALNAYPQARVDMESNGLLLHPSPAPIGDIRLIGRE